MVEHLAGSQGVRGSNPLGSTKYNILIFRQNIPMKMDWKRFEVFMEFLVFGLVIGVIEDLIVVKLVTREPITWRIFSIAFLVALPFAFIGEILVDRIDFVEIWQKIFNRVKKNTTMRNKFSERKCVPCESGIPPLEKEIVDNYLKGVEGWSVDDSHKSISKEYKFRDFKEAMNFVEKVAEIANQEDHHPDIYIHYNKVSIVLFTHAIDGLHENDFILASKIDDMAQFSY